MFSLFVAWLGFSESLACDRIKCLFLNTEPCMVRATLINMNPNELKYCPFIISLYKSTGSCNVLSPKICVPKETKDKKFKAYNMIINR